MKSDRRDGGGRNRQSYLLAELLKAYGNAHPAYKLATVIVMRASFLAAIYLSSALGPLLVRGLWTLVR